MKSSFGLRQGARNAATTVITFGFTILTGLFFTPYLLSRLGPESYGLVMLAAMAVTYGAPLVQTLSTTLARELAFARTANDPAQLQALFDRAMALSLRLVGWFGVALLLLTLAGPWLLGVSLPFRAEASVILLVTGLAFLVWTVSSPFSSVLYVTNRVDIGNNAQLLQAVTRIASAVLIIELVARASWAVPGATLIGALVAAVVAAKASLRLSSLSLSLARAVRSRPLELNGMGAAVLLYLTASAFLLGTPLPLVSHLADERTMGFYAAATQIAVLVRGALLSLSGVFGPLILARWSEGDDLGASREAITAMRWLGIIVALPAGVAFAAAPMILEVWLGPEYAAYAPVLRVEMVSTIFLVAALPMSILMVSSGRMWWPAIVRLGAAVGQIVLALVLVRFTGMGVIGVAAALALMLVIADFAFATWYAARIVGGRWGTFVAPYGVIAAATALAAVITVAAQQIRTPTTVLELIVFGAAVGTLFASIAAALFGRQEMRALYAKLRRTPAATADPAAAFNPEQLHP